MTEAEKLGERLAGGANEVLDALAQPPPEWLSTLATVALTVIGAVFVVAVLVGLSIMWKLRRELFSWWPRKDR